MTAVDDVERWEQLSREEQARWLAAEHDRQLIDNVLAMTPRDRVDGLRTAAAFFARARPLPG